MADESLASLIGNASPFELEQVVGGLRYKHAPPTLRELYARTRSRSRITKFIVDGQRRVTLGEFFAAVDLLKLEIAGPLRDANIPRIGILLPNGAAWATAFVSVTELGATAVLLAYDAPSLSVKAQIQVGACSLILTDTTRHNAISGISSCAVLEIQDSALFGACGPERADPPESTLLPLSPESDAIIAFTSGSTGTPKGVLMTHEAVITGLWNMMLASVWSAQRNSKKEGRKPPSRPAGSPCALVLFPLTHVGGYSHLLLMLAVSGCTVLMNCWNPDNAAAAIRAEGVRTLMGATPAMIRELLRTEAAATSLPLSTFSVQGAALRRGLMTEILKAIPTATVTTGFGMTETGGSIASASGVELFDKPAACGPVLPTVEVKIIDEAGSPVGDGVAGEICIRGRMLLKNYFSAEGVLQDALVDGWLHTADIGSVDGQGILSIVERSRDVVYLGQRRVSCGEIERILDDFHYGDDAVAMRTEDGRGVLIAILRRPNERLDLEFIRDRVQAILNLPEGCIKVISSVEFPTTSSGKIDRNAVARLRHEESGRKPEEAREENLRAKNGYRSL